MGTATFTAAKDGKFSGHGAVVMSGAGYSWTFSDNQFKPGTVGPSGPDLGRLGPGAAQVAALRHHGSVELVLGYFRSAYRSSFKVVAWYSRRH